MERMAVRLRKVGGVFIQMEDEIGSISAVLGASWAGAKAMTATSGPGFSLMQESIGYAAFTETPCVIINVQRAGPGTGQATRVGSGDIMQAKWGSHGDYQVVALSPWSAQEMPAIPEEVDEAVREGVKIYPLATPVKIIGRGEKAIGIEFRLALGSYRTVLWFRGCIFSTLGTSLIGRLRF
jgi:hypothetical protein